MRSRDWGLQWELNTTDARASAGAFLSDGKRIALPIDNHLQIWDYGKNVRSDESQVLIFPVRDLLLFPNGRRFVSTHSIRDLHSGVDLERLEIGFECAIVNDSFLINTGNGQLNYWRRRRVEGSWSPLSFPEAWVTGALAIVLMFNIVGDWRRQRTHDEHVASCRSVFCHPTSSWHAWNICIFLCLKTKQRLLWCTKAGYLPWSLLT